MSLSFFMVDWRLSGEQIESYKTCLYGLGYRNETFEIRIPRSSSPQGANGLISLLATLALFFLSSSSHFSSLSFLHTSSLVHFLRPSSNKPSDCWISSKMIWKLLLSFAVLLSCICPVLGARKADVELSNQYTDKYVFAHFMVSQASDMWSVAVSQG